MFQICYNKQPIFLDNQTKTAMTKATIRLLLILLAGIWSITGTAQDKKIITGAVKDSAGNALPGVTVGEKGTTATAITDMNGNFKIAVSSPSPVLLFSSVGFESTQVPVGNKAMINVTMEGTSVSLEGVVVTSLGLKREQKALGYAVSTIKAEDITKAGSPNFASALYGKAPGVRIGTTPGGATSAVNITIRGVNSITGKNQPLIVLDGVPIREGEVNNNNYWDDQRLRGNGLLDINPEDIENISILKGASAAALYGSEAVNGVVLITTKSGKGKKGIGVDVTANYSFDKIAYLPRYQNERGPGAPLHVANGGQSADGFVYQDLDGDGVKETRGVGGFSINFGPKFDGQPTLAWDGQIRPYEAQKDNFAGLYRTANNSSVTAAISQSGDAGNMRLSLTRQGNQGISLGAENTKNIANLNSTLRLGKKYSADILVNYINQHTKNRPYSIDRLVNNFAGMMGRFDNADWYLNKIKTSKGYRYVTGTGQSLTPDENIIYPGFRGDIADYVWRIKEHNEDEYSNRVIASLTNNWQIFNELKLRARIATDFTSMRTESRQSTEKPIAFGYSGAFGFNSYLYTIVYGDVLLTYSKKITPEVEVNVMGGYTGAKETGSTTSLFTNGGLTTENKFDIASSANAADYTSRRTSLAKDAFIGTINGSYKNFLFVEGTLRRDRTSTMNPNQNSFVYPSVNSSLILSEAFNLPAAVSYSKLRASWGIVGNYPLAYQANIAYTPATLGVQQTAGSPVLTTTVPANEFGNDAIKPEQKYEYEFGVESRFLNNRLGLDVSYYNAQIRDQILYLSLPASSGARSVLTNIGTLRNKGIEIAITGTPVRTKNFSWDAGINFSQNKNVVEKLTTGSKELLHQDYDGNAAQLRSVVGQPMGDFYVHPVLKNAKGEMVVGSDGLYELDADTMVAAGNAMPKVTGGVFNSFSYKGFTLDFLIDFRLGGYVMPTGVNWMNSRGLLKESLNHMDKEHGGISYYRDANGKGVQTNAAAGPNGEKVHEDGMLMEGVTEDGKANTNVVSQAYYYWLTYNWGGPQYGVSRYELYVQKNSYVKFREVTIGYSFPTKWAGKVGAKKLQLSVFGRNLFYLYRTLKDLDAEQTTAGSRWYQTLTNAGTNPSTRSFGVMLRAGF
jgi:iron complex outermembrane receptor protein